MNFDLARPRVAVSTSRDCQLMNKTKIARERLEIRKSYKERYWEAVVRLSESVMNFDLARPRVAVWTSCDFQQMNKTEIARERLEIHEKLQRNHM